MKLFIVLFFILILYGNSYFSYAKQEEESRASTDDSAAEPTSIDTDLSLEDSIFDRDSDESTDTETTDTETTDSETTGPVRVGDRWFVFNRLYQIFSGDDDDVNTNLKFTLKDTILKYPSFFGASCDLYEPTITQNKVNHNHAQYCYGTSADSTCSDSENELGQCFSKDDIDIPLTMVTSAAREGLRIQTCFNIIDPESGDFNDYVDNAIVKICDVYETYSSTCDFDAISVDIAYQLFYPFVNLPETHEDYFVDLFDGELNYEISLKNFLLALCLDPNWQSI